jgi:PhnB protein
VQPYLFFDGRCEEALSFYKSALGAEMGMLMRWKDSPEQANCPPANADKVMHAEFKVGETTIMASDGNNTGKPAFQGFYLAIHAKDESEFDKLFNALTNGGQVTVPPTKTFFSPRFGMAADKFGVGWMVVVEQ